MEPYSFESSGTTHKQLTFSEFSNASYTTEVSNKFTEYLKLCYRTWSRLNSATCPFMFHSLAKEKRQCYTLGPVPDVTDAPSHSPQPPDIPPSHPPPATGPNRVQRVSRQARLGTGPLPPHPKGRVLTNKVNSQTSRVTTTPVNAPTVEIPSVRTPSIETPSIEIPTVEIPTAEIPSIAAPWMDVSQARGDASTANTPGPIESNARGTTDRPTDTMTSTPNDNTSDSESYTSTLPDVFNVDMDGSEPPATGPWVAIDHLTGKVIGDDSDPGVTITPGAHQTEIEIGILPRLGVRAITEAEPPALLSEDEEVRPEWLTSAVKEFLRYMPYYGRLGKVIDLFLAQEARLGYPNLVLHLCLSSLYLNTDNLKSMRLALPSCNRPTEVGQFQKWARKYSRGDNVDAEKFGATVVK